MNFKESAIYASELYYNYLTKNKGALVHYSVSKITKNSVYYFLQLKQSVRSVDDFQLKINSNIFSQEQFSIIEYNNKDKLIKIAADKKVENYLLKAKAREVEFIVDLRFLVINVKKFYEQYGNLISIPKNNIKVRYIENHSIPEKPSEEQSAAIIGALSNPLSYIWGAPGTGKTKFVLARCVISHLQSNTNAKILITAPTNTAVEQTLFGVLPILASCGINLDEVFRMGTPSTEFMLKYPNCCEFGNIDKKVKKIEEKLNYIEKITKKTSELISLFPKYKKTLDFRIQLDVCKEKVRHFFTAMKAENARFNEFQTETIVNSGKITLAKSVLIELSKEKSMIQNNIEKVNKSVNKYNHGIIKKIFKKKLKYFEVNLKNSIEKIENINLEIKKQESDINYYSLENINISEKKAICETNFKKLIYKSTEITSFCNKLKNIILHMDFDNIDISINLFNNEIKNISSTINEQMSLYEKISNIDEEELLKQLSILNKQKENLIKEKRNALLHTPSARITKCRVLAATVDSCISRVNPNSDFKPTHIFLDEAGYCSLIKGVTLLTYNCPLTLLGDHMQLPPVCVMNDDEFRGDNSPVSLYAQSALYLEEYNTDVLQITDNYLNHCNPKFEKMVSFNLNHTFRFGEKLASILSKNVYTESFHGTTKNNTQIYYIDAPKIDPSKPRYSSTEIEKIKQYVKNNPNENIGIISPYKFQTKELNKALHNRFDILTVHASQSREWDTVIFSVVDSTNKWFTNSNSNVSNGLKIINTAVSRVKKKLIIVCDVKYWMNQKKQLIGQILQIGEELNFEE